MDPVIVVENRVDCQCVRHVHLMSNEEMGQNVFCPYGATSGVATREAGVWHYRTSYPYKGILDVACVGSAKGFRRLVVWNLDGCGTVRNAISQAEEYFFCTFHFKPGYVFMKKLPRGVENGAPLGELMIFETEWMLDRCVAIGGRDW